jgi:hypothetical protein
MRSHYGRSWDATVDVLDDFYAFDVSQIIETGQRQNN